MKKEASGTYTIDERTLYRPKTLEKELGRRCLGELRAVGLRTIAGWYPGKAVLECLDRAWHARSCQRVPIEKEEPNEKEYANGVDEGSESSSLQSISLGKGGASLSGQIDRVRGLLEETISSRDVGGCSESRA